MCGVSKATADQQARAEEHGDVLIVDVRQDWNGLPIQGHKKLFCFRAEQNGISVQDRLLPGKVLTRFLYCSCASCAAEEWDHCLLKDEVMDWESVSERFELKVAIAVGAELCVDLPKVLRTMEGRSAISVSELKSLLKNWGIKFASKLNKPDLLVVVVRSSSLSKFPGPMLFCSFCVLPRKMLTAPMQLKWLGRQQFLWWSEVEEEVVLETA